MNTVRITSLKNEIELLLADEQCTAKVLFGLAEDSVNQQVVARLRLQHAQSIRHTYRLEALLAILNQLLQTHPGHETENVIADKVTASFSDFLKKRHYPVRKLALLAGDGERLPRISLGRYLEQHAR